MTEAFKMISIPQNGYLSAYPNAGLPNYVDGRYVYEGSPAYFEAMTPRFIEQGIRLLGGCCGTTPEHIQSMKRAVANITPVKKDTIQRPKVVHTRETFEGSRHSSRESEKTNDSCSRIRSTENVRYTAFLKEQER